MTYKKINYLLIVLIISLFSISCRNQEKINNNSTTTSSKKANMKIELKNSYETLKTIDKMVVGSKSKDDLLKALEAFLPIDAEVSYVDNPNYGSGIVADRTIELVKLDGKDNEISTKQLNQSITNDPLKYDLFDSWNSTAQNNEFYRVSVFVHY